MSKPLSRAVQERRAPKEVEADTAERKRWRALDWYATPPFAARAGAELILRYHVGAYPKCPHVLEPACGDGIMAECLKDYGFSVVASDISPQCNSGIIADFLLTDPISWSGYDWIVTNPPFEHADAFVRQGLRIARVGVAVLCRLSFLEGINRYPLHHTGEHPLSVLAPFSERVPMQLGPWNPKCSTATAYAWFVYLKRRARHPVEPIPPGTRARLSRPDDIRRFCKSAEVPLLVGANAVQKSVAGAG